MNTELTTGEHKAMKASTDPEIRGDALRSAALGASRLIAPLWPLKTFVAVNPMLGFTDQSFAASASVLAARAGASLLMDRGYYRMALEAGAITPAQIEEAIERLDLSADYSVIEVEDALHRPAFGKRAVLKTVADVAADISGEGWPAFVVDQISFFAAGHFDEGEAKQKSPWRDLPAYEAWRAQAMIDRSPEIMGVKGFRRAVRSLPEDPISLLALATERLGVQHAAWQAYFHRLLMTVAGWAGHVRYRGWVDELRGGEPEGVIEILAIRAAYELVLLDSLALDDFERQWTIAAESFLHPKKDDVDHPALIAQTAMEIAMQERLVAGVAEASRTAGDTAERPFAQMVFCIDVRSERMRRALEATDPEIETFGFAGFFGFPIEVVRFGEEDGGAQCPVLLEPGFAIRETPGDTDPAAALKRKTTRDAMAGAWKRFKNAAVSSFAFVEAWGLGFAAALLRDSARKPAPETSPLGNIATKHESCGHRSTGMTLEQRIATAEGALAGMSLTGTMSRLVVLAGHGSTTTNNPYAAGLDCGACGGHSGEANAKVAAAVLNDAEVRAALAEKGTKLPEDTVFVAALHDTTTDEIVLYDEASLPESHGDDLARLKRQIAEAGRLVRRERAPSLGLEVAADIDGGVRAKSQDWSEVRPEWGLAGCAAFIAAPRARTRGIDLGGRAFLHSYEWEQDGDNAILELIMTAPLVVASWISLQYFGSTVDNQVFGSGDKTLHNVVGALGVLEGVGGDLRPGLPFQSVHDGKAPFHQPLRLCAMIEAPIERIDAILTKHPNVRALFDNQWLSLIAILDEGESFARYAGDQTWSSITPAGADRTLKVAE